jgi:hypothetical protein
MLPVRGEPATSRQPTEADVSASELAAPGAKAARTKTVERGSAPTSVRTNLPPPPPSADELGGPTLNDNEAASIAAAINAANATIPNRMEDGGTVPNEMPLELSPLEIELELDEPDETRPPDIELDRAAMKRKPGESMPPVQAPHHQHPRASSSVGAAALPPKPPPSRLPSRPAISPPQVVSRPLSAERRNEDAVEVYAPPPPGAELPSDRPGQYSQHKRVSQKVPTLDGFKDRTASGAVPVPPGLVRPGRISSSPSSGVPKPLVPSSSGAKPASSRETGGTPAVQASGGVPANARDQSSGTARARTPTPSRLSTPSPARTQSSSGGVVMTRPAVIVGAPAKPNQPARVRKAREDEGRGFGQGLISEKSLDEVILAYLSEDADEK